MTLRFLLTSFVICATHGTGALFRLAAGLARGYRGAMLAAFACTLGVPEAAGSARRSPRRSWCSVVDWCSSLA